MRRKDEKVVKEMNINMGDDSMLELSPFLRTH